MSERTQERRPENVVFLIVTTISVIGLVYGIVETWRSDKFSGYMRIGFCTGMVMVITAAVMSAMLFLGLRAFLTFQFRNRPVLLSWSPPTLIALGLVVANVSVAPLYYWPASAAVSLAMTALFVWCVRKLIGEFRDGVSS